MFNRLYIHVPFCLKKCHYCAFVSSTPKEDELAEYPELVLRELQLHEPGTMPLASIYVGGGTPSLLRPSQLAQMLVQISGTLTIAADAEITLEVNPGTVDYSSLQGFRRAGINRISLGIQSFDDSVLHSLGRIHTANQSIRTIHEARKAGFDNISIDLIHSLPGQTLAEWHAELQQAADINPEHISVYGLTVEEGTPFARSYPDNSPELADEDHSADMFELADDFLGAAGYEHYEIANYARPGYRPEHNSGYWKRDGYLGLGVAAHSFLREGFGRRFSNPDTLDKYRLGVMSGQLEVVEECRLTLNDAMAEYMYLGLRLTDGLFLPAFEREFGRPLESIYPTAVADLIRLGLLMRTDTFLSLTRRGMLLSNQVFSRFLL